MKYMKVAEARAQFGELLDEAEKGSPVGIVRRGVKFRIVAEEGGPAARTGEPLFDFVAPDVMAGGWTWTAGRRGLTFTARKKR